MNELKAKSPFYPGQPVPQELFVGRESQIARIVQRGIGQTAQGKPTAFFVQGEYGIGKSSFAGFLSFIAETQYGFYSIYGSLAGAKTKEDFISAIFEATIRTGAFKPHKSSEKIREFLAKYLKKQELGGIAINFDELKKEIPSLTSPYQMLAFLEEVRKQTESQGLFLILDEINGIAGNAEFAHFIKGLIDQNALSSQPVPLLLMLCGVEDRRREMIRQHESVDRIFDVIDIEPMTETETRDFFKKAFTSVRMTIDDKALQLLVENSAGFPRMIHILGDAAFWIDTDNRLDPEEALRAIYSAAYDVGQKFVNPRIYSALKSEDYHSILSKLALRSPSEMKFLRKEIAENLTDTEKRKLDNFLRKMTELNMLRHGDYKGEYQFVSRMERLYIWLKALDDAI